MGSNPAAINNCGLCATTRHDALHNDCQCRAPHGIFAGFTTTFRLMHRLPTPVPLLAHPGHPPRPGCALSVVIAREADGLRLSYRLAADLNRLRLPSVERPAPVDRLWAHTCLEAFIAGCDEQRRAQEAYREFNFSPSGQWAAYAFAGYRERVDWQAPVAPQLNITLQADVLQLEAWLPAALLPDDGPLRLGLSAVLEDSNGELSYHALHHPAERPDFHHPDSFALRLPALS